MTAGDHTDSQDAFRTFGLGVDDLEAWNQSGLGEESLDRWLLDRVARRPSGQRARRVYGAEDVHDFARAAILHTLALGPGDHLLEVGCGGGLLLRDAMHSGAKVTGIDHSEEMIALAPCSLPTRSMYCADAVECCNRTAAWRSTRSDPSCAGMPAAPEPIASLCHLHTDAALAELARSAGLQDVVVHNDGGGQLLTARVAAS